MKRAGVTLLLCMMGISLAGCGMRNYLEKETPTESLNARQDLTMPPDLRLPPPGTTAAAPDPGAAAAMSSQASLTSPPSGAPVYVPPKGTKPAAPVASAPVASAPMKTASTAPVSGPDAVYVNAGISLTNPDGTRKTAQQLNKELQEYYVAQKKAQNPNYGSVFNIGNIFKDE